MEINKIGPSHIETTKPSSPATAFTVSTKDLPTEISPPKSKDSRLTPHVVGDDPYINFQAIKAAINSKL